MTTDSAMQHAKEYHAQVYAVSVDMPAPEYSVWSWDEMPEGNRRILTEASRRFMGAGNGSSAEQLAIALMSAARKLYAAPVLLDKADQNVIADRLAQWATDVRQLGNAETRKREAEDDLVMCNEEVERLRLRLERVRELVGRIEPYDHGKLVAAQVRDIMDVLDG